MRIPAYLKFAGIFIYSIHASFECILETGLEECLFKKCVNTAILTAVCVR